MKSIELHVLESDADIDSAMTAGLIDIDDIDGATCAACYEDVGYVGSRFYAYAIVLDDVAQWTLCATCIEPVVDQR